jgi:arylsulfatase A-like enzyme
MPAARPNFVFFFPDQWRGDCLSWLGHPVVETPFLDEVAAHGVTFTRAYSPCPSCIAARASLLTGMTPSSTGRLGYRDGVPWRYPDPFPRVLRDGGYQTLCVGKTHFFPQRARLGFEEVVLYDPQRHEPNFVSDYDRWLDQRTGGLVRDTNHDLDSNSWVVHPWTHDEELHASAWTSTAAIELLGRRDPQRPFFLQVSYHRPHPPLDPPVEYLRRYEGRPLPPVPVGDWAGDLDVPVREVDSYYGRIPSHQLDRARRAYFAQVGHLDYQIGRVVRYLRRNNLSNSTYLVFSSDHGELLGDHHMWRKFSPFEGSARVPLIVKAPSGVDGPRGVRCGLPVGLHDLMPTFLDEAGLAGAMPAAVEGRSLAPLVRGREGPWRGYVHGEHSGSRIPGGGWQFVVGARWKFMWQTESGRELLFDLDADPQELHDLAADAAYAGELATCRGWLVEELARRPDDGLTDGRRLIAGKNLPQIRPHLLEPVTGTGAVAR